MADSSSFWDSITPDFSDPGQMAVFGALGNVLQTGTAPRFAPNGMGMSNASPGNALLALAGAGLQGLNQGANFAQNYKAEDLANQNASVMNPIQQQGAQMNLDVQKAAQPYNLGLASNPMSGGAAGVDMSNLSPSDKLFMQAYSLARISGAKTGDYTKAADVLKTMAEKSPVLAGQIKAAEAQATAQNSVNQTANGPQVGTAGMPGASPQVPFSLAPMMNPASVTSGMTNGVINDRNPQALGPGAQQAPDPIPQPPSPGQINASALQPPSAVTPAGGMQLPSANPSVDQIAGAIPTSTLLPKGKAYTPPAVNPNSKVSVDSAVKSVTDDAANLADAGKTYNIMMSNFPNVMQRIGDMSAANNASSFGAIVNDEHGNGIMTSVHNALNDPTSVANAVIKQRAAQGVLPELAPQLGDIKPNKSLEQWANQANNINLSDGQSARQAQFDGLAKGYIQNMVSYHDQIQGYGGTPAPLPTPVVAGAVKYGVVVPKEDVINALKAGDISRSDAVNYFKSYHGMQ